MLITSTILSLLSYEDLSGYDIKKKIQDGMFFPWSGNNNQVYKALSELQEKAFVASQNIIQLNAPAKKVYSITEKGAEQLKEYAKTEFAPIQLNKPFILRLLASTNLSKDEFKGIIENYRNQLYVDLDNIKNKEIINIEMKNKNNINDFIINQINLNATKSLELELEWLDNLENELEKVKFENININAETITQQPYNGLKYELKPEYLLYEVNDNGDNNELSERIIKDICINVIENNLSHFVLEEDIFVKGSLTKEFIELMSFEFKKYNISFEIK